jgi:hypothetical protein
MTSGDRPWEIRHPWETYDPAKHRDYSGSYGIYELADADQNIIYVGMAGGQAIYGLRGKIAGHFSAAETNPVIRERARYFRYEINNMYLSRLIEHGRLPEGNEASGEPLPTLARFTGGRTKK